MKNRIFLSAILFSIVFTGCIKDKTFKSYTITRPEYSIRQEVKDAARLQAPEELKDPGNFILYKNAMYINEKNKGIHVFDYSNPVNPVNRGFIPIPGNLGLSVKNDVLYADCYSDLFVFQIHSVENIQFRNTLPNAFLSRVAYRNDFDTNVVKVTLIRKDTTVSQEQYDAYYNDTWAQLEQTSFLKSGSVSNTGGGTSVGSSMAVFAIVNEHLYTVDNSSLNTFSIKDAYNPVATGRQPVSWNVETIFPFKDRLFIGSMTGMFIYSIADPGNPKYLSRFQHARVCDPVIADDLYAFVTLRNGSQCGGFVNQMDVLNISDLGNPVLIKSYPFSNPHGLSKDGNVLFVCDGDAGLKVVDATDVNNLVTRQSLPIGKALDVVALNGKAFVMLNNSIRIYSYDQQFNIQLLSSINIL